MVCFFFVGENGIWFNLYFLYSDIEFITPPPPTTMSSSAWHEPTEPVVTVLGEASKVLWSTSETWQSTVWRAGIKMDKILNFLNFYKPLILLITWFCSAQFLLYVPIIVNDVVVAAAIAATLECARHNVIVFFNLPSFRPHTYPWDRYY